MLGDQSLGRAVTEDDILEFTAGLRTDADQDDGSDVLSEWIRDCLVVPYLSGGERRVERDDRPNDVTSSPDN